MKFWVRIVDNMFFSFFKANKTETAEEREALLKQKLRRAETILHTKTEDEYQKLYNALDVKLDLIKTLRLCELKEHKSELVEKLWKKHDEVTWLIKSLILHLYKRIQKGKA